MCVCMYVMYVCMYISPRACAGGRVMCVCVCLSVTKNVAFRQKKWPKSRHIRYLQDYGYVHERRCPVFFRVRLLFRAYYDSVVSRSRMQIQAPTSRTTLSALRGVSVL